MTPVDKILLRAIQKRGKQCAKEAMELMGFIVTVENGWVVRKNSDGSTVKIEQLKKI